MNCPNCNKKLNDDEMFCLNCGQFINNGTDLPAKQKNDAEKNSDTLHYLTDKDIEVFEEREKPVNKQKKLEKKDKVIKNIKLFAIVLVFLFIALPLINISLSAKNKAKKLETLIFMKDEEIHFVDNSLKPLDLPEGLIKKDNDFSFSLGISANKKNILYGTKGNSLYYKKVNSKNPAQLIDTGVTNYYTNYDASKILYGKGADVYYYDTKESKVISSNIYAWMLNKKIDKVLLWDYNNNLYFQDIDKKAKQYQVDKNVSDVLYIPDDFSFILYDKDGSLMLKKSNKEAEKIDSNVFDVFAASEDKSFFYVVENIKTYNVKEFFKDDFAVSDSKMKKPKESEFQKQESYTDIWGKTQVRTITDHEALNEANKAYEKKLLRDDIRKSLDDEIEIQDNSIYYYNGSKSILVSSGVHSIVDDKLTESNKQIIIYTKQEYSNTEKININNVESVHAIKSKVNTLLNAQIKHYIAINKTEYLLSEEDSVKNIDVTKNADSVFYMTEYDYKTKTGNLRKANIKSSKISENTVVAEAIHSYVLTGKKQDFIYFKSVSSSVGDMYFKGKKIASDVLIKPASFDNKSKYTFLSDYDSAKKTGNLSFFDGKKTHKITDDAHSQNLIINAKNNETYFFKEYKTQNKKSKAKGDLYVSNNKKIKLIDTDVYSFALINQNANFS